LSYISGVLIANYSGGLLLLVGIQETVGRFLNNLGEEVLSGIQLLLGMALILFGLAFQATSDSAQASARRLRSVKPGHTFLLGMIVMANEITTALPYFIAIERIIQARPGAVGNLLALATYNVVFSLPLFAFLALYVTYGPRFTSQIDRLTQPIMVWTVRIVKYGAIAFGILLALDTVLFFSAREIQETLLELTLCQKN
jgi:cytochrome c biogenesis protein CcdA